ncbi:MAG: phosphoglycerate dehydrogenase [Acidobacteria bacterium]|nr:phosphoglycerate dehydrogenase [Acidobacteriota bacterium]
MRTIPKKIKKTTGEKAGKEKLLILLLEGIHPVAVENFQKKGFADIETRSGSLSEEELLEIIPHVHMLGIRSKTKIRQSVLDAARQLLAIGCFCIGTDQVDLKAAAKRGVAVFNAPFSNTRSVAELVIAEVVMLARRAAYRSMQLHNGEWEKSAKGCIEVRRKTIGIVGYGHIGPQVGVLAEAMGMKVVFHDIIKKLPLGNARQLTNLKEVLKVSDFVTLHVPDTNMTRGMIGKEELKWMREGSYLLNLSRGSVVDLKALRKSLISGHLAGAALDVYPREPKARTDPFDSEMRGLENVILTPHIGGSTEEAQKNIGMEVSEALADYAKTGSTAGCTNLPEVQMAILKGSYRVLNIHKDMPGVLSRINGLVGGLGVNINAQSYSTKDGIGYLMMDVEKKLPRDIREKIESLDSNIKTRLLF